MFKLELVNIISMYLGKKFYEFESDFLLLKKKPQNFWAEIGNSSPSGNAVAARPSLSSWKQNARWVETPRILLQKFTE